MSDVTFARPLVLLGLAVAPVLFVVWLLLARRGARRVAALSRSPLGGPRVVAAICLVLALAAAVVAAAQPRWGTRQSLLPRTGAQLVVVMDVSRSMSSRDVAPSRLDAAKSAVIATIARLGGDRVGLVVFAGDARLRFPLTTDFAAASQVISSLETGTVLVGGGTSTASGLDIALQTFDPETDTGKLIVLITDGDDLGGDPATTAQRIRDAGISLLVAGVGTSDGSTVPVFDSTNRKAAEKLGADGQPIVTKLNEPFLRAVAAAAGGRYVGSDLRALPGAVDGRLTALKRGRFEQQAARIPVERYQWFAAAALALLVLASVVERLPRPLRPSRRVALAPLAAIAALLFASCATRAHDFNEQGRDAFRRGDHARAIELFTAAQAQQPDDSRLSVNLAAALHAAGRYDDANLAARRALGSRDPQVRARAEASIGHSRFALGDLPGALDAFKAALLENPGDGASRHDYEVVLRMLQPPPPSDPGQQGGQDPQQGGQQPGQDNQPGGQAGQQPGQGQQQPGQGQQQPGQGQQQPGQGQQQPGQSAGQGQGNGGNRPNTPQAAEQQIRTLDGQISRLVREAGETPTPSQALEILRLLAERDRLAGTREALGGTSDPNDY